MTGGVVLRAQVTVRHLRIIVGGHLHSGNAHLLPKVLVAALRCYPVKTVKVDVARLEGIDAIGVAALDVCRRHATARRIRFRITRLNRLARTAIAACEQHQLLAAPAARRLRGFAGSVYSCAAQQRLLPLMRPDFGGRALKWLTCHPPR